MILLTGSDKFFRGAAFAAAAFAAFGFAAASAQTLKTPPPEKTLVPIKTDPVSTRPTAAMGVDSEPNSTTASFGDWSVRCQRIVDGNDVQRVCEVVQQMRAQDQQSPVAELAIGRVKKGDPLRLTALLPVNVTFPTSPSFSSSGNDSELLDLGWRRCLPGGCFADLVLPDGMLSQWRTQAATGRLSWKDASGRDLVISVSPRGLAQALDAMSKEL